MLTKNVSFIIESWMLQTLNLKGNELIAYAIIYKYSDIKGQQFMVSIRELAEIMNVTKNTAQSCINSLIDKGLILKNREYKNNCSSNSYHVDYETIENMHNFDAENSGLKNGTVPKNGTSKETEETTGVTGVSNQGGVPKIGHLENIQNNNTNKPNKLNNNLSRKQGGLLRGVEPKNKANKFSTLLSQLSVFCLENFKTKSEQQLMFDTLKSYLNYRIKFKLEPEQWQALLDTLKGLSSGEIEIKVQVALAGGYKILVPSWELTKKSKGIDNIQEQEMYIGDDVEGVYF